MSDTVLVRVCMHVFVCSQRGSAACSTKHGVGMLIPQQGASPEGEIISYSGSGSAIGILTTQQIKEQVCM